MPQRVDVERLVVRFKKNLQAGHRVHLHLEVIVLLLSFLLGGETTFTVA